MTFQIDLIIYISKEVHDLINVSEIAPFVPSVIIIQILKIIRQGHNRRLDLVVALIQGRQGRGCRRGNCPSPPDFGRVEGAVL